MGFSSAYAGYIVGGLLYSGALSCYYIEVSGSNATSGAAYKYDVSGTILSVTLTELNSYVSTMNSAAGDNYFTAGNPTDTYLPSLMGESIKF